MDWGPSSAFCSGVRCTFGLGLAPNQEPTTGCNEQRTCKQRHRGPTVSAVEAEAMEARQRKDRGMEMGTTRHGRPERRLSRCPCAFRTSSLLQVPGEVPSRTKYLHAD